MLSAVHAGPEVETDLLGGPYACAAAGAIGLTLEMPHGGDPAMYGGMPARLAPVWEGEQVAESPYQRFMQVQACSASDGVLLQACRYAYFSSFLPAEVAVTHACLRASGLLSGYYAIIPWRMYDCAASAASTAKTLNGC